MISIFFGSTNLLNKIGKHISYALPLRYHERHVAGETTNIESDRCSFVAAWIIDFVPPCAIPSARVRKYWKICIFCISYVTAHDITNKLLICLFFIFLNGTMQRRSALIHVVDCWLFGGGGDNTLLRWWWHINTLVTVTHTLTYLLNLFCACLKILHLCIKNIASIYWKY